MSKQEQQAINWSDKKREILARVDVRSEVVGFGVNLAGNPNSGGWIPCHNPYRKDHTPSAGINVGTDDRRGFLVLFNQSTDKAVTAISFWDLARDFHPELSGEEFPKILKHYADKTGICLSIAVKRPPTMEKVEQYIGSITHEVREFLHNHRGLNDASIGKYQIGWNAGGKGGGNTKERLTYPVYDMNGSLVNIRFHAWKKNQKPKTLNWSGFGEKRLWGIDRLIKANGGATVCVTTGEWDSMLIEQETGLVSVSPTNGDQAFMAEWVAPFYGKNVILVCDCDLPSREAVMKRFIPAFRPAVRRGDIPSVKVVWLFDDAKNKDLKDFTDFITKAGGSGPSLIRMIEATQPERFSDLDVDLPDPIILHSFKEIDNPEYVGHRVSVPLYIHGENSEAYHAPTKIMVGECIGKKQRGCHGREDWDFSCDDPIPIPMGNRVQLTCVANSDFQMKSSLREFVCDKGSKPVILMDDKDRLTIREVYAHQIISDSSDHETVEKAVYTIGGKIYPIGQYQATGYIHSHPRNQKPTMLIDYMEAQEEDWQAFDIDKSRPLLRQLQALNLLRGEILDDLMYNVTKIYERYDLHLGVLLVLCSPKWIDFGSDDRIRGWISAVVIGDSGTGKSTVSEKIFEYAGVGYRVSGMTSSRTGITYACEYDERKGWRIKAGALLKMSGQAMIIDEAQDLAEEDLKTMAEALDRGRLKIDRIQNKEFAAETRCFFSCNPVNPRRRADQRTMASYKYGCRSVGDIFPKMMLRRLDFVLFAASFDIKEKDKVFNQQKPSNLVSVVTPENLKALIYYAWNLKPEQIIIPNDVSDLIRSKSSDLAIQFGGGSDLPIVYPEDFRKTFCRMCVACAVIDLSSEDDFETIVVRPAHVLFIADQLEAIYSAKNCQLDKHSTEYEGENTLSDEWRTAEKIRVHMQQTYHAGRAGRLAVIFNELLRLDPESPKEKLSQVYLKDLLDVSRQTIFEDMKPLLSERLVVSSRGYLPTPKMFMLWHYLSNLPEDHPHYKLIDFDGYSKKEEGENNEG